MLVKIRVRAAARAREFALSACMNAWQSACSTWRSRNIIRGNVARVLDALRARARACTVSVVIRVWKVHVRGLINIRVQAELGRRERLMHRSMRVWKVACKGVCVCVCVCVCVFGCVCVCVCVCFGVCFLGFVLGEGMFGCVFGCVFVWVGVCVCLGIVCVCVCVCICVLMYSLIVYVLRASLCIYVYICI